MINYFYRNSQRFVTAKEIQKFHQYQMEVKDLQLEEERKISKKFQERAQLMADSARQKAANELKQEVDERRKWGLQHLSMAEEKRMREEQDHQRNLKEMELADAQQEVFQAKKFIESQQRKAKTVANGAKQHLAYSLLKKDVLDKIVDDTDYRNSKVQEQRRLEEAEKQRKDDGRKEKIAEELRHYHKDHQQRCRLRKEDQMMKREAERQREAKEFSDFLNHLNQVTDEEKQKAHVYKRFWDDQCKILQSQRTESKDFDRMYQEDRVTKDLITEDNIEAYAERLISRQKSAMKDPYPIEKAKSKLGLSARGKPALVASDNSKIRMYSTTKDIFYRPEEARERMSINWNPK